MTRKAGTVSYDDPETKERITLPVTGGHCKLQWKPDWAMRWYALGVDYEMAGKDFDRFGSSFPEGFVRRSAARRRKASITSCSSTSTAKKISKVEGQRAHHRRMAALRFAGNRCPCSCTASRSRRSGCIST